MGIESRHFVPCPPPPPDAAVHKQKALPVVVVVVAVVVQCNSITISIYDMEKRWMDR